MKKRIVSLLLILVLAFTLVPSAFAAGHNCGISNCVCLPGNPCSAVWEWQAYGSDLHWYVARCSGCGQIEFNWSSQAPHSFDSDGVCTVCGFVYVGDVAPELCPVCKVPSWKFEKVEGRA